MLISAKREYDLEYVLLWYVDCYFQWLNLRYIVTRPFRYCSAIDEPDVSEELSLYQTNPVVLCT